LHIRVTGDLESAIDSLWLLKFVFFNFMLIIRVLIWDLMLSAYLRFDAWCFPACRQAGLGLSFVICYF